MQPAGSQSEPDPHQDALIKRSKGSSPKSRPMPDALAMKRG